MKAFVDTNVFVAATVDEPGRGDVAARFLNQDHEFYTSVPNLMEYRTVLAKKKRVEQEKVEALLTDITDRADVYFPDIEDFADAYELQRETLLYPLDCLILTTARSIDATLVTFDSELIEHRGRSPDAFV
ncbi:type II toxin-antitoxin system VapC family toxin [Halegenticoccus tardaugens]|uniref:type II toxin-antitoxin system VapC family toxin n=1 Tax=Halegenticoccus tardaugens TaxID=2071624 RepID=UPI00100A53EA|nr:PIN domain-containing protein [Halegenticoccus tardaugens]